MSSASRVAGTKHWDKYAKGVPTDLSDEQREVRNTPYFCHEFCLTSVSLQKFLHLPLKKLTASSSSSSLSLFSDCKIFLSQMPA